MSTEENKRENKQDNKLIDEKYLRMSGSERIQHFLLFSSFIVLILTGFGLKFPESFWVQWIVFIIGENAFEARGVVHRIASVVMIVASVYHLYYISFTPRGKQLIKDFFPRKQDIIDFKNSMLYLVGRSDIKPRMGRFSYIEKMEYWAVVWGTVIMGGTGMVLWFENTFLKYIGTMGMDIATAIHYYEAILASLAILVWHFYFIFLNPDVYPMNKAWLSGFLTRKQMEHEHPLELEKLHGIQNDAEEVKEAQELKESESEELKEDTSEEVKEKITEEIEVIPIEDPEKNNINSENKENKQNEDLK
jgi:formate dehydrogenase gamma subunit